ncbi:tRNA (adenosine(37)-N6)-threonylcarbamoyltransferase complex dimerization subunit type 1 TsaB [Companilactobacillus sp. RD055328]|uniref:tRNA (adenosine(37)-N6)-threonylcarbamoyltransferase complex dimerization subunit type 1 TsaB n=1 Tax=Companilactobacillus sp. RD055328 TaxID=2916634 RepID=UPI001FC8C82E|nr:tRNA (adenosine(37)-N6)-threonylcarbamoyltransferase complex dimerization subunit type 1 TsaB [Companilactobacillus sp. RD055328]GKQ42148.1 tRNA (adenosine(37)-N6)-threonylcarbamoyltransferase complex dimerization subunit type 1 TsaB [Companilactobacillus sp. RD055328]
MKTLAFDTSNTSLSVSVDQDGQQLASFFSDEKKTHSVTLLPAIEKTLQDANLSITDIDEIVVAQGPGSFTGVRIAVTTAKTLAYTLNKQLKGVSSLQLIAANITEFEGLIVPYFDARRSNVFAGAYELKSEELIEVLPDGHYVIDDLITQLESLKRPVMFVGTPIEELTTKSDNLDAQFSSEYIPNAHNLVKLAKSINPVTDIDAFIPKYLRYTKAEYDWLKTGETSGKDYVQRV